MKGQWWFLITCLKPYFLAFSRLPLPSRERAHIPPNGKAGNSSSSKVPWLVGDMMLLVPWKGGFTQIWFDFYGIDVWVNLPFPMDPIGLSPFHFHSIHLLALYLARLGCPWPGRLGSVGYKPNTVDGRNPASTS